MHGRVSSALLKPSMLPSSTMNQSLPDLAFLADRTELQPIVFLLPFSAPCAAQQGGLLVYLLLTCDQAIGCVWCCDDYCSMNAASSTSHMVGNQFTPGNGHLCSSPLWAVWKCPANPEGHHETSLALQEGSAGCPGGDDRGVCLDGCSGILLLWQ